MTSFVDRAVLHAAGGRGGDGCASVRREKFVPLGGPDGGNGGRGGDVVLAVDASVASLRDIHLHPHARGGDGRAGQRSNRHGATGADRVLAVPDGTAVHDQATGELLADLVGPGVRHVLAHGGRGGLGNAALAGPRRRHPGFALLGEPGETRDAVLELKAVADAGLVGFPNAGKSSLLRRLSNARPKVADYPFTTLAPHLGVLATDDTTVTVADVPGLLPGASSGRGLGLDFLRHVERCAVLVHVLDCAAAEPDRDPLADLDGLEAELADYAAADPGRRALAARPRLVALNKIDLPEAREMAALVAPDLEARGLTALPVSAATGEGTGELAAALAALVVEVRRTAPPPPAVVLRPRPLGTAAFEVRPEPGGGYRVSGAQPERWVGQTDFGNEEAVGYLAARLARLGVEGELARLGARPGDPVVIAGVTFDWEPGPEGPQVRAHR